MKEVSAMGERVWGYTMKGFEMAPFLVEMPPFFEEMAPLRAEMAPFQELSPVAYLSFIGR